MRKNDNFSKNGEDRKGFWRIGYLENQEYPRRMMELTRRTVDHAELDAAIEEACAEHRETYYNAVWEETTEDKATYGIFPTGQRGYYRNKEIFGGFYRMEPADRWKGVYLEQDLELLRDILSDQRQRSALEDYTYIYDYSHIAKVCNQEFVEKRTEDEWANYIGGIFLERQKKNEIYSFPTGSYFPAEDLAEDGRKMYFWMEQNDKQGVRQTGFGLSLVDKKSLLEKWTENQYKHTLDRMTFSNWEALEDFVEEVAQTAMPENWGRLNTALPESQFGYPVLKSYLEYTLIRLRDLDRENHGYLLREEDHIYFNTGLLNKFFRQILVGATLKIFTQDVPGLGTHVFEFYFNPYLIVSGHDTKFSTENNVLLDFPKLAYYFEKKEDVLYDASLEIMLNDEHIFEDGLEAGRIPMFREEYQANKNNPEEIKNLHVRVQARIQTAIQRARLLAERNYKLAIPQFWKESAEIQFLLPLYMEETEYTGRPQCALALRRVKNGKYYEGATILSLDMAYNNARLIAKPDVTWLNREDKEEESTKKETLLPSPTALIPYELVEAVKETIHAKSEKKKNGNNGTQAKQQPKEVKKVEKKAEKVEVSEDPTGTPNEKNIGKQGVLTNITSRPSGKGLKGHIFNCVGTIPRNLLKNPVPHYTGGTLKVEIVDINPQGNQYLLSPIE